MCPSRRFGLFLGFLAGCLCLSAQSKGTHEFAAGIGFQTIEDLGNNWAVSFGNAIGGVFGASPTTKSKDHPTFGGTYRYAVKNRWMLSADFYYQKGPAIRYSSTDRSMATTTSFMVGSDYRYGSSATVQMYSGASFGIVQKRQTTIENKVEARTSEINPALQLTFFGIRIGQQIAGTAEIGLGYKGLLNLGLSYHHVPPGKRAGVSHR